MESQLKDKSRWKVEWGKAFWLILKRGEIEDLTYIRIYTYLTDLNRAGSRYENPTYKRLYGFHILSAINSVWIHVYTYYEQNK